MLINDARSEIERLRRQLAGLESAFIHRSSTPAAHQQQEPACSECSSTIDLSVAAAARRAYAVVPLGEVDLQPPPPISQTACDVSTRKAMHTVVTNLGSMMDVLL